MTTTDAIRTGARRRPWSLALIVIVAGTASVWLALRGAGALHPIQRGMCSACNVLLVTIDTLRSDRVGAFGGPAGLTPAVDRLAGEGLRLTRTYTAAPLTLPSHASILTGTSPPVHGLRTNGLFRLGETPPTLAALLKRAGYRTGAFVGAFVLDARFGLNRGFDVYDDRYGEAHAGDPSDSAERPAEDVIKPATAWILGTGSAPARGPWFAWVHLYDPHEPYRAPEPYASRYAPYDAEVAYTDAMVGRLLADLGGARQLDRTLVVVAADHGESLGEHGERSHGVFAYDATLRVPWIIWAGSRLVPQAWDGVSRLIDLAPTTLDLLGQPPAPGFEGRSIVDAVNARETISPPAYFEAMDANLTRNWAPLTGIVRGREKLIDLPIPELYDLERDPREMTNLFDRAAERARALEALLHTTTAPFTGRVAAAEKTTLSADARQRLQALGYVASSAGPASRVFTDADDPKTLIEPSNDLDRALAAFKVGSRNAGMAAVREIMRTHPAFTTPFGIYASMQRDLGDLQGAITTLDNLARRATVDQSVVVVLAGYLQEAGAADKAVALLETVIAAHPDYADAYNSLGVAYSRLGRHDRARAAFRKVLELDPTSAAAYENLGVDAESAGDPAAAVADLTRALELDPRLAGAHNSIAAVLLRQGRRPEALAHWRSAVELSPRMYDALYNLGTVLFSTGRRDEARPYLERFVADAPRSRYERDIVRVRAMLSR